MAENCRGFVARGDKPFFLYFCTSDPHRGGGTLDDVPGRPDAFGNNARYPGVDEVMYRPEDVIVPPWMPDTPEGRAELAQYYRSVSRVDRGVGRLVEVLKEAGVWEESVFLYASDNGIAMPGSKTTLYEPGMKLPLIARLPESLKPRRGTVSESMVSWVDLTPTILDLAGVSRVLAPPLVQGEPEGRPAPRPKEQRLVPYTFHGRSFRPTLGGDRPEGWDVVHASHQFHEITMYYPMRVIRTPRHKLIYNVAHPLPFPFSTDLQSSSTWQRALRDGDGRFGLRRIEDYIHRPRYELYDLAADPAEARNLADDPAHAGLLRELSARLKAFQEQTRDPWVVKYAYE